MAMGSGPSGVVVKSSNLSCGTSTYNQCYIRCSPYKRRKSALIPKVPMNEAGWFNWVGVRVVGENIEHVKTRIKVERNEAKE